MSTERLLPFVSPRLNISSQFLMQNFSQTLFHCKLFQVLIFKKKRECVPVIRKKECHQKSYQKEKNKPTIVQFRRKNNKQFQVTRKTGAVLDAMGIYISDNFHYNAINLISKIVRPSLLSIIVCINNIVQYCYDVLRAIFTQKNIRVPKRNSNPQPSDRR